MRMRLSLGTACAVVSACATLIAPQVRAQAKASEGAKPTQVQRKPPAQAWKPPKNNAPKPNPAVELRRFLSMKPEQREKEINKLPPQQRERMQNQIARFESLPPEQRERQLQRLEAMQNLPPERRQAVNQEIQRIREAAPPAGPERRQFLRQQLYNEDFRQRFSPEERELIFGAFPAIQPRE